jgi:hypothetical protein
VIRKESREALRRDETEVEDDRGDDPIIVRDLCA